MDLDSGSQPSWFDWSGSRGRSFDSPFLRIKFTDYSLLIREISRFADLVYGEVEESSTIEQKVLWEIHRTDSKIGS